MTIILNYMLPRECEALDNTRANMAVEEQAEPINQDHERNNV